MANSENEFTLTSITESQGNTSIRYCMMTKIEDD